MTNQQKEILSYLFFGILTTCVSWGSYAVCVYLLNMDVAVGNAISWLLATLFAFTTNKIFVFKSLDWQLSVAAKELAAFVSARLGTGIFELVSVPLLVRMGFNQIIFGVKGSVAKITVSLAVVIVNYIISKVWIFRGSNKKES